MHPDQQFEPFIPDTQPRRFEMEVHVRTDQTGLGDHVTMVLGVRATSPQEAVDKALAMMDKIHGHRVMDYEVLDPE
jgi:hypothetical protein